MFADASRRMIPFPSFHLYIEQADFLTEPQPPTGVALPLKAR